MKTVEVIEIYTPDSYIKYIPLPDGRKWILARGKNEQIVIFHPPEKWPWEEDE